MDDLISRKAVRGGMMKYGFHAPDMTVHEFVEDELPSIPAVPLEPLAKWLAEYAVPPVSDCLLTTEARTAAWKAVLNKFVEEQDAVD